MDRKRASPVDPLDPYEELTYEELIRGWQRELLSMEASCSDEAALVRRIEREQRRVAQVLRALGSSGSSGSPRYRRARPVGLRRYRIRLRARGFVMRRQRR